MHEEDRIREEFSKITSMVRRYVRNGRGLDCEDIALDIWLELWIADGKKKLCWQHVRNRCIDALRRETRVVKTTLEDVPEQLLATESEVEAQSDPGDELVNHAMACPTLTNEEKFILYCSFYRGMSGQAIADAYGSSFSGQSKSFVNQVVSDALAKIRQWLECSTKAETRKEAFDAC
jgi:RNA polymerase sigma factor (sigma-70 family)